MQIEHTSPPAKNADLGLGDYNSPVTETPGDLMPSLAFAESPDLQQKALADAKMTVAVSSQVCVSAFIYARMKHADMMAWNICFAVHKHSNNEEN